MHHSVFRFLWRIVTACKPFLKKIVPSALLKRVQPWATRRKLAVVLSSFQHRFCRSAAPDGVNLIGYIKGEIGLGQSCRLVADALAQSGAAFTIYNVDQIGQMRHSDSTWDSKITNTVPFNINLIHINPSELVAAYFQLPASMWAQHYNIGFWLWELEEFPDEWCLCMGLLDEIWTPAEFVSESIRKKTSLPVRTVPYAISAPTDAACSRSWFHLPENQFLYLTMYDCNSTIQRKNPLGVIAAYKRAFPVENPEVGLVIKVNNPQQADLDMLRASFQGYRNIYLMSDILTKVQVNSLVSCVDVLVSLHRAEGFGLALAEAMLLGTPVVATNWSANTEFMSQETACMIDYSLVPIEEDYGPYKAGNRWADADLEQAAEAMQKLWQDPAFYQQISQNAKRSVTEQLSLERAGRCIQQRIDEIYSRPE
jgi:glycosyltransferase involved in cell wall biosynthesis